MKLETTRFGEVEIPDDRVITFPEGLPGFDDNKLYFLIHSYDNPTVHWLQSASDPDVALLLMDPLTLDPSFSVTPRPEELRPIGAGDDWADSVLTRVIVRSGEHDGQLFANFFAPVFFNVDERVAMQLPMVGSKYSVREVWPRPEAANEDG